MSPPEATLSVVVVAYEMQRELPRTLRSLATPYQVAIGRDEYEIIVVDNGSPAPVDRAALPVDTARIRVHRIDDAPASPARAANAGIELASGEFIGLIVDGARMASPGLLSTARLAAAVAPRPIVTAPVWHLGHALHMRAAATGYDRVAEDRLLAESGWEDDGYELFSIATLAASSGRGLFGPMGESSSLFLSRELWNELGELDERFALPGGGLVNHDLYRRACSLDGVQLVVMLGEGTFHQIHGGAATSAQVTREQMWADYEAIRGERYRPPENRPIFVGRVPAQYLPHIAMSAERVVGQSSAAPS